MQKRNLEPPTMGYNTHLPKSHFLSSWCKNIFPFLSLSPSLSSFLPTQSFFLHICSAALQHPVFMQLSAKQALAPKAASARIIFCPEYKRCHMLPHLRTI